MRRGLTLGTAIALVVALIPAVALAQSPGPSLYPSVPGGHPAHIHTGLCPEPGPIQYGLSDVSEHMVVNGSQQAGDIVGPLSALPALVSVTKVGAGLLALADGNHAVNVHQSAEDMATYIACGDIGGVMIGTSDLAFGLAELNNSGFNGVAYIHDNGDDTSTVYVFLMSKEAAPGASPSGGPAASPAPSPSS
jgi:hypothetical protein